MALKASMKTKISRLGLHCCSAQARTGQLQALFALLNGRYRSVAMPYQASVGSAERAQWLAHGREVHEKVSSSYRRRASRCSSVTLLRRRLEGNCQGQLNRPRQNQVCSRELWQLEPVVASSKWQVVPNTSFKPSPNGVPRGPGWRYAVHFRHPGPRVTPLVPA